MGGAVGVVTDRACPQGVSSNDQSRSRGECASGKARAADEALARLPGAESCTDDRLELLNFVNAVIERHAEARRSGLSAPVTVVAGV